MKHVVKVILSTDTIDWANTVRTNLERQRQTAVSFSDALEYIAQVHWRKTVKRLTDQKHADKVGDRLKRTSLITPKGVRAG